MARIYSLKKSSHILHHCYPYFSKKGKNLSEHQRKEMGDTLRALEKAIIAKNVEEADRLAKKAEAFTKTRFKKTSIQTFVEIAVAIAFALAIAIVVRQVWFELYEIPTGSMRPSFREKDRLTVTKTAFGINIPLQTNHIFFDPGLVKRGKVFIFSGENIPGMDQITNYFWVFPTQKRYIKRMIGKPGDSLYFYGGKIYGVDKEGNPIDVLLDDPWMQKIEHIPFISFEGDTENQKNHTVVFKQMGQPIAKMTFNDFSKPEGKIFLDDQWKGENSFDNRSEDEISNLGNFWGIENFAMARLLDKNELDQHTAFNSKDLEEGILYLQLKHHPNLSFPAPKLFRQGGGYGVLLPTYETVIPLKEAHIQALRDNMYTARFVVDKGFARPYSVDRRSYRGVSEFPRVPDGTYELYNGEAEEVGFYGWTTKLGKDHPLNSRDPALIKSLFNQGIDFLGDLNFDFYYPRRYAYFRDGDLYLMGAPIMTQEDPILKAYVKKEKDKGANSTTQNPYIPFIDRGPPLKDGKIDIDFIKTYGVRVPENSYLALGDNHAMSADSRIFGFVPEANIQGAPSLVIWPPGDRLGWPPQTPYPFITFPRLIVWGIALTIFLVWYLLHRRKMSTKLFPEDDHD